MDSLIIGLRAGAGRKGGLLLSDRVRLLLGEGLGAAFDGVWSRKGFWSILNRLGVIDDLG